MFRKTQFAYNKTMHKKERKGQVGCTNTVLQWKIIPKPIYWIYANHKSDVMSCSHAHCRVDTNILIDPGGPQLARWNGRGGGLYILRVKEQFAFRT